MKEIEEVISLSEFIELIQDWDLVYLADDKDDNFNVKIDFNDPCITCTINNFSSNFTSILRDLLAVRIREIPNLRVVIKDVTISQSIILEKEKTTDTLSDGTKIDATEASVILYYLDDSTTSEPLAAWVGHYSWDEKVPSNYKGIDIDEMESYLDTFLRERLLAHDMYVEGRIIDELLKER